MGRAGLLLWTLKCGTEESWGPKVREMAPFGRRELASQVPEEGWLLSNRPKSSCSPGELISGYLVALWGIGVSCEPNKEEMVTKHNLTGLNC